MRRPRLSVRALMILIAVVGLLLGSGMFLVRCIRVQEYAQQRVRQLTWDVAQRQIWLQLNKQTEIPNVEEIRKLARELGAVEAKKQEFKHLLRHPWHEIPFGETIGATVVHPTFRPIAK
jgi:hypothetical protein